jgi:hypothetical protein
MKKLYELYTKWRKPEIISNKISNEARIIQCGLEFLAREIRHEQEIKKDSTQEESQTILI